MIRRLISDEGGLAMTEFALTIPFLLVLGLMGLETANRALVQMQISQLAVQVADNASRMDERGVLQGSRIYEEQVNDVFLGALLQIGAGLKLEENGRIILSSVEVKQNAVHGTTGPDTEGAQFIHWQRCIGALERNSDYGTQNSALPNGMGPAGAEVYATEEAPVMYVEIYYEYQPIARDLPFADPIITSNAAFIVRDDRDQSQLYKRDPDTPTADCNPGGGGGGTVTL